MVVYCKKISLYIISPKNEHLCDYIMTVSKMIDKFVDFDTVRMIGRWKKMVKPCMINQIFYPSHVYVDLLITAPCCGQSNDVHRVWLSNVLIQGRCVLIIYNEQHLVTTYKLTTATVTSYTKTQLFPVLIPLQIPGSLVDILKNNDCLITIKTMLCKYNVS